MRATSAPGVTSARRRLFQVAKATSGVGRSFWRFGQGRGRAWRGRYAYRDRKKKKRNSGPCWITRIKRRGAAARGLVFPVH